MSQIVPIVEAVDLGRQADDGTWLLRHVDFVVCPGDRLAVVGSSGSGKTLLLRSLATLDPIQSGRLVVAGRPVTGSEIPRYRTQVVYLQQRPVLFEGTVEFNLKKPFELAVHRGKQYDRARIATWLDGLHRDTSFLEKQHHNLSGGEAQIAALLRTMQLDPQVLLLDEPTAALDAAATAAVERLVNRWLDDTGDRGAFVWITHTIDQADRMCDVVYQMSNGELTRAREE